MNRGLLALACGLALCRTVAAATPVTPPVLEPDGQARFLVRAEGVLDRRTGLLWERCSHGQRWQAGLGCVGLAKKIWFSEARALEDSAWRLPSVAEMQGLYDDAIHIADAAAFPDTPVAWYWAAGPKGEQQVWGSACERERDDSCTRTNAMAVRLVRRQLPFGPGRK